MRLAIEVAAGPHITCWDNINISTSIFVEQRKDAPSKVQSGTFAVLYQIDADPNKLFLPPISAQAKRPFDMDFDLLLRTKPERGKDRKRTPGPIT